MQTLRFKPLAAFAAAACLLTLGGCANLNDGLNGVAGQLNKAYSQAMAGTGLSGTNNETGANGPSGPIYSPISGGNRLQDLFAHQDRQKANYGQIPWPRVALTYMTYGENLPCWTVRATIWNDAKHSHNETFKVCTDHPIEVTNMTGDRGQLQEFPLISKLEKAQAIGVPNTGDNRTTGPLPPRNPFAVQVGSNQGLGQPNLLRARMEQVNARIAYVSGYLGVDQGSVISGMEEFRDYRMWIAGFDPSGRQK